MVSGDICEDRSRMTVQEDLGSLTLRVSWWVLWVLPTPREGGSVVELIEATKDASTNAQLCWGMPRSGVLAASYRVMKEIGGHHGQLLIGVIPKSPSLLRVNALIPEIFQLILAPSYKFRHFLFISLSTFDIHCILEWEGGRLLRWITTFASLHQGVLTERVVAIRCAIIIVHHFEFKFK